LAALLQWLEMLLNMNQQIKRVVDQSYWTKDQWVA